MLSKSIFRLWGAREMVRCISKTASTPNSDCVTLTTPMATNRERESDLQRQTRCLKQRQHNNRRALSTLNEKIQPASAVHAIATKEEMREFMSYFPDIVRGLTDAGRQTDIPEVRKWFNKVLQYNLPDGKKIRGLTLVTSYKLIDEERTPDKTKLANILGWCVEMLQAGFLVADDIMDHSETRRGRPCWYKVDGVGLTAINDTLFLHSAVFSIIRQYLADTPYYVPIMELFNETLLKTVMGQALDSQCLVDGRPNLDAFTMKRYDAIVKYKTAYYTFHLPVASAMLLGNRFDPELHRQAKTILLEMGNFFQVQDDFLDCFGNESVTGKASTDIADGKCSWLVVVALQRASPAQKELLNEHYGRADPESVAKVKNLYEDLGLPNTYAIYEEDSFNLIRTHIQQISKGLPHSIFFKLMDMLYKREC